MLKYNEKNVRIIRHFAEAMQSMGHLTDATINGALKALKAYQTFTRFNDFANISISEIQGFKQHIIQAGKSRSTLDHFLHDLKRFFSWLSEEKTYTHIDRRMLDAFTLSKKDKAIIKADKPIQCASFENTQKMIRAMPSNNIRDIRNRAMLSLTFMTGARNKALVTLKFKSFDPKENILHQDPRDGVLTKNLKYIRSVLYTAVGDDIAKMFLDYYDIVTHEYNFTAYDPLFPSLEQAHDDKAGFTTGGLSRNAIQSYTTVNKILKQAFMAVDMPYYSLHRFRNTLTNHLLSKPRTEEEIKAFSLNLGHEHIKTTRGYIKIDDNKHKTLIENMSKEKSLDPLNNYSLEELLQAVNRKAGVKVL